MGRRQGAYTKALIAGGIALIAILCSGAQAGTFRTLHLFSGGSDGREPHSVIPDASGNLYGTTAFGGEGPCDCGIVFKIAPDGTKTNLHSFAGGKDGGQPFFANLISDSQGNLYGTTQGHKTGYYGTVFKLDASGHLKTLHTFRKVGDGRNPLAGVVMDQAGNLYGTTARGGRLGKGTVYKIAPGGRETVLHSFLGTTFDGDGDSPAHELILDNAGNLYGSTGYGGSNTCGAGGCCGTSGCGTVFKVAPDGTTTILYRFLGSRDGRVPAGNLAMDKEGNLYGMTEFGGIGGQYGGGIIFRLAPGGTKSELHAFELVQGFQPQAGLIMDRKGNLYGTAQGGTYGYGVVFELTAKGKYKVLHDFTGGADGEDPAPNNLTLGEDGTLYGATRGDPFGGGGGTVFAIDN